MTPCTNCQACTNMADDNCAPGEHPHCDGCEHCFYLHVPAMVRSSVDVSDDLDAQV